jgi:DNA repair exonuclease SbcCD ATPase subunit
LEELITFAEQRAEEQRQKAAVEFNTNIKKLIESLGFKEFRTIRLDNAYRLYVERLDPKTSNYVFQPVNTLSESEKLSIALILQVALKETYMPDIPFFIIDGVIQDFDEDRRVKVLDYLSNKAEERDWFIVVTRLTEDAAQVRVRLDGR